MALSLWLQVFHSVQTLRLMSFYSWHISKEMHWCDFISMLNEILCKLADGLRLLLSDNIKVCDIFFRDVMWSLIWILHREMYFNASDLHYAAAYRRVKGEKNKAIKWNVNAKLSSKEKAYSRVKFKAIFIPKLCKTNAKIIISKSSFH